MTKNLKIILFSICFFVFALFIIILGVKKIFTSIKNINTVYTYLGDSISSGYALPNYEKDGKDVEESFGQKFGKQIGAIKINNLAVTGAKTEDLLKSLKTEKYQDAIKESNVITVSIGSNDVMRSGLSIIYNSVNTNSYEEFLEKLNTYKDDKFKLFFLISNATNSLKDPESTEILQKGVKDFETNFKKIIDEIKDINSDALIIVESFYNPYKDLVLEYGGEKIIDFGETVQQYIDKLNFYLFNNNYYNEKYFVSDISSLETDNTNVVFDFQRTKFSIDPHPNTKGHDYIFKQTLSVYEELKDSVQ